MRRVRFFHQCHFCGESRQRVPGEVVTGFDTKGFAVAPVCTACSATAGLVFVPDTFLFRLLDVVGDETLEAALSGPRWSALSGPRWRRRPDGGQDTSAGAT